MHSTGMHSCSVIFPKNRTKMKEWAVVVGTRPKSIYVDPPLVSTNSENLTVLFRLRMCTNVIYYSKALVNDLQVILGPTPETVLSVIKDIYLKVSNSLLKHN